MTLVDDALTAAKTAAERQKDSQYAATIAQTEKNRDTGASYSTGQKYGKGQYVPSREPKGSSKGGRFAKGKGGGGGGKGPTKEQKAAVQDQIDAEREAARQQTDAERQQAQDEGDARRQKRMDEDNARQAQRVQEDIALGQAARTAAEVTKAKAQIAKDRQQAEKLLADHAAEIALAQKTVEQLTNTRKQAGGKAALYDDVLKQATDKLKGLQDDGTAQANVDKLKAAEDQLNQSQTLSASDVQDLRDRVHLTRAAEDIAQRTSREAEDQKAREQQRAMQDRIAQRQRDVAAHAAELRKGPVTGSIDTVLCAKLRLARRRMLVRASLTTDLNERAVLQASAAQVGDQLVWALIGSAGPIVASAGFDGAAIVLMADEGTVDYPDGTNAPLHVTIAYLGPAADLSPEDVDAAGNTAQLIAGQLDPFTPEALSPARFGDTDVLLLEHPGIQRARDLAMTNRNVAGLVGQNDEHPTFIPHCSGADIAPRLDRAAVLLAGDDQMQYPLGRESMTAAFGRFEPDLHPRGHDGKFIEKFGLVDIFGLHGFQHGQRGDKKVYGQVVDIIPDPANPGDPIIRVKVTDPRWDPGSFGETVDVRRNQITKAIPVKAHIGKSVAPAVSHAPVVPKPVVPTPPRTPTPLMVPSPDGPGMTPLATPPDWEAMAPTAKLSWLDQKMAADFTVWRGKDTFFDFSGFEPGIALNMANTYRDLTNWDPATARRIDYPIVGNQGDMGSSIGDLGPNAIAVAVPGTAHPGGIGPVIGPTGLIFGNSYMANPKFWASQKVKSDGQTIPWSTSAMTGDPTVTLIHEFGHQRQFRFLDTAMSDVGQAWSPTVRDDGFGMFPDSSTWPETQALRYAIPKATPTEYGQSKTSEGFAEAWAARLTGHSSPELDGLLDQWDTYMGISLGLPKERYTTTQAWDALTPEEQDEFWKTNGPMLDLPGMRDHYPDSAAAYDAWQGKAASSPAAPPGQYIEGVGDVNEYLAAHPQEPDEADFVYQARILKGLSPKAKHQMVFKIRERYPKVDYIAAGATRWRAAHGLPEPAVEISEVPAPAVKAYVVARAFEQAPDMADDPHVQEVFAEFKKQSDEMFDFMTRPESEGGMGITVDFWTNPDPSKFGIGPYNSATAQAEDLRLNHHIFLEAGLGGAHELTMTQDEYDRFRAVHDTFGHAGVGGGFDRHGEYQAYLMHASMYTGDGERGMASEYHGVNTALWSGDPNDPGGTGKSVLLPEALIAPPWDAQGNLVPMPSLEVLGQYVPEIIELSPTLAAAQALNQAQLDALHMDAETDAALTYMADQVGFGPAFASFFDRSIHYPVEPPPFSEPITAASFDPDLHPRGHDGKFIEIGKLLEILSGPDKGERGKVTSITPDRAHPGHPRIRLGLNDGRSVVVAPNDLAQAREKATLGQPSPFGHLIGAHIVDTKVSPQRSGHIQTISPDGTDVGVAWEKNPGFIEKLQLEAGRYNVTPKAPAAPQLPPMTRADFSNPDTPRTRAVTEAEYAALSAQGEARLAELKANRQHADTLDGPAWETVKQQAWDSVQTEWGGITIDTHTGEPATQGYAITIRPSGTETVAIPLTATQQQFDAAMEEAKKRWGRNVLQMSQGHIGAFRNQDIGMFEVDPVLVVDSLDDVDTIGTFTRASGGAYSFADGNGYWPPYVGPTAAPAAA